MIKQCTDPAAIAGTHLQGYVSVSYDKLVELFGEPNGEAVGGKTDAEWLLVTSQGIATIYNYKDGKNYLGEEGSDVKEIVDWHVGGHNERVVEVIRNAIENNEYAIRS